MAHRPAVTRYREKFLTELKKRGWDQLLYPEKEFGGEKLDRRPNRITLEARPKIKIFDVRTDGTFEERTIQIPQKNTDYEDFLRQGWSQLQKIPADLATRIIVTGDHDQLFCRDLLGVHYDIPPAYFRELAYAKAVRAGDGRRDPDSAHWPDYDIHLPEYIVDCEESFVNLGKGCLSLIEPLKDLPNGQSANLVISSYPTTFFQAGMMTSLRRTKTWASFDWHGKVEQIFDMPRNPKGVLFDSSELFDHALKSFTPAQIAVMNADPLLFLTPVLEVLLHLITSRLAYHRSSLLRFRHRLGEVQSEELAREIQHTWISLSEMAFEWDDACRGFRHYDDLYNNGAAQKNKTCEQILKKHDKALKEVGKSEEFALKTLGGYVDNWTVEDSKVSIRQAKLALEDSQRSRLITILAFVFVPISLGTSVFGMNISELNESGQPVWVFVVTTIVLAWLSTMIWAASFQWHLYYNADDLGKPGEFSIRSEITGKEKPVSPWYRLGLFIQLLAHGHILWAWNSGVMFSLLTSGRKSYVPTCRECSRTGKVKSDCLGSKVDECKPHDIHSPCSYIAVHLDIVPDEPDEVEPFKVPDPEIIIKQKNVYVTRKGVPSYAYV